MARFRFSWSTSILISILAAHLFHTAEAELLTTFSGSEFIYYNFSAHQTISYNSEQIRIEFKTSVGDGLLFYTGDNIYFINIGLANGSIYVSTHMGNGSPVYVRYPAGNTTRLDDNQWHSLVVSRVAKQMTADVDNGKYDTSEWKLTANFSSFKSRILYLGGGSDVRALNGSRVKQNYFGCLRNVAFTADTLKLRLLTLAYKNKTLLMQQGEIKYNQCSNVSLVPPVTLLRSEDYLSLPSPSDTHDTFISLDFKTTATDGLLLYNHGMESDVFAVELLDGYIYLILQQGEDYVRKKLRDKKVNNGVTHSLIITFRALYADAMKAKVYYGLDGVPKTITVGRVKALELTGPLYLGAVNYFRQPRVNPAVYTATLRRGFVGCLENVKVDGPLQNLVGLANEQGVEVGSNCTASANSVCPSQACNNLDENVTARFDGNQYILVNLGEPFITQAEELQIKFKTRYAFGSLLFTKMDNSADSLEVFLYNTKLIIRYNTSGFAEVINAGDKMNDNAWHSLSIKRLAKRITVDVDNSTIISTDVNSEGNVNLEMTKMWIGSARLTSNRTHPVYPVMKNISTIPGFTGHIQRFVLNGVNYLAKAKAEGLPMKDIGYTCQFTTSALPQLNVVTVKNTAIPIQMSSTSIFKSFSLQFRTNQNDSGLIMYGESPTEYIGLELLKGDLKLRYGRKNYSQTFTSENMESRNMDDNNWHYIAMTMLTDDTINFRVDSISYLTIISKPLRDFKFNQIFIAGVNFSYFNLPQAMISPHGFKGCIGSVELNGIRPNLIEYISILPVRSGSLLQTTCQLSTELNSCSGDTCSNGGKCMEIDVYEVRCQCDMTTYTGATCSQDGISFIFGDSSSSENSRKGGLVSYKYSTPFDTRVDTLAVRINTRQNKANVLKVTSSNTPDDMIELRLVRGVAVMRYNVGDNIHMAGDPFEVINDGKDHVIRFWRNGPDGVIQIDKGNNVSSEPLSEQLRVFNGISKIEVGGSADTTFIGTLTGLVFDGTDVFKYALDGADGSKIEGNVRSAGESRKSEAVSPRSKINTGGEIVTLDTGSGSEPCDIDCLADPDLDDTTDSDDLISTIASIKPSSKPAKHSTLSTALPMKQSTSGHLTTNLNHIFTNATPYYNKTASVLTISVQSSGKYKTPPSLSNEVTTDSSSYIDITKNIPLVAGISGAALLTIILIAIIACRLTRKPSSAAKTLSKQSSSQNGTTATHSTLNKDPHSNGVNLDTSSTFSNGQPPSNPKEWYV